jgi:hypothetical protein
MTHWRPTAAITEPRVLNVETGRSILIAQQHGQGVGDRRASTMAAPVVTYQVAPLRQGCRILSEQLPGAMELGCMLDLKSNSEVKVFGVPGAGSDSYFGGSDASCRGAVEQFAAEPLSDGSCYLTRSHLKRSVGTRSLVT